MAIQCPGGGAPVFKGHRGLNGIGFVFWIGQIAAPGRGSSIGIGGRDVLRDPMTKEIISKVPVLDEYGRERIDRRTGSPMYEDNDYWFVLNFKVKWEGAPKPPESAAGAMSPYGRTSARSSTSSSSSSTKGAGGQFDF